MARFIPWQFQGIVFSIAWPMKQDCFMRNWSHRAPKSSSYSIRNTRRTVLTDALREALCAAFEARILDQQRATRRGLTIIEVLVCSSIIFVLMALLFPAVVSSRESSRRMQCTSNLRQIGIALQNFEGAKKAFPQFAFQYELLPYLDNQPLYDAAQPNPATGSGMNWEAIEDGPAPFYACPADGGNSSSQATNYLGNWGSDFLGRNPNGFFGGRSPTRVADITRGLSQTAAVGEGLVTTPDPTRLRTTWGVFPPLAKVDDLPDRIERLPADPAARGYPATLPRGIPWFGVGVQPSSYNHLLPPNRPSGMNGLGATTVVLTTNSAHSGGVNLLYADGRVSFINESIERGAWRAIGKRAN